MSPRRFLCRLPACGDPPQLLNTQVGEGRATHLGRFSVRITFCMDVTDTNVVLRYLLDDPKTVAHPFRTVFAFFAKLETGERRALMTTLVVFESYFVLMSTTTSRAQKRPLHCGDYCL